jgi:serine/threonine protein kinase
MDSLRPGDPERIGGYVLYRLLGVGGMGEVFLGRSPGGKAVAVKLISPLFAGDPEFRRRFRREVEAGRKVGGFHAAQVIDADLDAERPWMVTTYVAGPSLKQVLAKHRALPTESVTVLGAGLAEALEAIHRAEVIHRDLKPSNILLSYDGPHVIDFGIASAIDASAATTQPGTPGFIAPEVVKGGPATQACDVFALGVVLAVAAGNSPFGQGRPDEINYRIVHEDPDLEGLDPEIRGLIKECLAKDPTNRPTSAQILKRLGKYGSGAGWLPAAVLDMIPGYAPPQPTEVVRPVPHHDSRLLEAEQAARRVPDPYARAEAQVYVARVVSQFDPAHALRLVDDTLRPTTQRDGTSLLSRQQMLRHLARHATIELGTVLARANSPSAGRMLDEIEDVIRSMIREEPATVASVVTRLAEAVASTDPGRADRIARIAPDLDVRASAAARAAMVVAGSDPVQADQMARAITRLTGRMTQPAGQPPRPARPWWRSKHKASQHEVSTAPRHEHHDATRLWAARALAEVAAAMAGSDPLQFWSPTVTEYETTITAAGDSGPAPAPARMVSPQQLLADAEQIARDITADDTRALALTDVTVVAARIAPGHAGSLLAEAEQIARTISSSSAREEALGEVALAAARTAPALAEQIARSLRDREHTVAEVASAVAAINRARAERIAAGIADEYVHALVMADISVRTDPANAEPQLREALQAAHHDPALIVKVAQVAARTDPARAEEMVATIRSRDNVRTADFWRAKALADLVNISDETRRGSN